MPSGVVLFCVPCSLIPSQCLLTALEATFFCIDFISFHRLETVAFLPVSGCEGSLSYAPASHPCFSCVFLLREVGGECPLSVVGFRCTLSEDGVDHAILWPCTIFVFFNGVEARVARSIIG